MRLRGALIALGLLIGACEDPSSPSSRPSSSVPPVSSTANSESGPAASVPEPTIAPPAAQPAPAVPVVAARVTRVVDGDTIHVRLPGGAIEKVRFIGVDTPESTNQMEPYGAEASAYTKARLDDREVFLEYDVGARDRFGRLLAYVWLVEPKSRSDADVRAGMFNARLLLDGYANVLTVPPNVRYESAFRLYEQEARSASRGLWGITASEARTTPTAKASGSNCDPSYPDFCIPPPPPDLDCKDVGRKRFTVRPPDPHNFDADGDGIGCER